jgi:hypothetical protein
MSQPLAAVKTRLQKIFVGSQGIRAGWSVLIFAAILGVFGVVLGLVTRFHHTPLPSGEIPPAFLLFREAVGLAMVLAATAVMAWIEGRSIWSYGLGGSRPVVKFLCGCVGGLGILSLLVAVLAAGGWLGFDGMQHGLRSVIYGLVWALVFLLVGLSEELLFRGYLQATLTRGIGFWPAACVLSLLFGAGHLGNHGESFAGIAQVILSGLMFCWLLWLSGSLWLPIGYHAAWDWAQSYLYGTPDSGLLVRGHLFVTHSIGDARLSGGGTGPEGSWLDAPVEILALLAMAWLLRRAGLFRDVAASS